MNSSVIFLVFFFCLRYTEKKYFARGKDTLMPFECIPLINELTVLQIYTVHYFEYRSDFHFPGERHNFWEFQCVDKGMAEVCTDDKTYLLHPGQIIFHKPNEFHTLKAVHSTAPNIVVVSFECNSPCMKFFEEQLLTLSDTERNLMGLLIIEARRCIASPLDDPYLQKMEKRTDCMFGSQQLIRLYLEQILIYMLRRYTFPTPIAPPVEFFSPDRKPGAYEEILCYLEEHIRETITIEDICRANLIGRSQLQKLFHHHHQCGVMDFFSQLKTELAKQLIRENQMNFTQISDFLGYSSIHYFSRQFKKRSGMTPSEYASSIKALSEGGQA